MARRKKKRNTRPSGTRARTAEPNAVRPSSNARLKWLLGALGVLVIAWCCFAWVSSSGKITPRPHPSEPLTTIALRAPSRSTNGTFQRLSPAETGVDFVHRIDTEHPLKYLYFSGTAGGGVAVGDVDADGRPDIYLVNGPGKNRLYRQVATLQFEDITEQAGVDGGDAWGTGATMADVNDDGWLDIYVCNYDSTNLLYINRGDGTFVEQAGEMGVAIIDASMSATFADYDRDGDLDMYLLTYRYERPAGRPVHAPIATVNGRRQIMPGFDKYYTLSNESPGFAPVARADGLFRNDGAQFTDVTHDAGMGGLWHGLSATWWDFNSDGWPDLYVANDFTDPDQLFRNNRDGTFTEVIRETMPYTSWYSMGADIGDINNDGHIDLLVADMSATTHFKQKTSMGDMNASQEFLDTAEPRQTMRNMLFLHSGTPRFMEASFLAGIDSTDWTWTAKLFDADNDGRLDAYFTNGSPRNFIDSDVSFSPAALIGRTNWDVYADRPPLKEANLAFRNVGDLRFENNSKAWGLDQVDISMAAAHADLDRDGDLDLVVANLDEPVSILRNDTAAASGILVQLEGQQSNRFGVGATVTVETSTGTQLRYHNPTTGFLTNNEPLLHFGLGEETSLKRLTVEWPSGQLQQLENLAGGKLYVIAEPAGPAKRDETQSRSPESTKPSLFARTEILQGVQHRERPYDDYAQQPLLPHKLSQLGPSLAWGDMDNDGDDDLLMGGAAGYPASLMRNDGQGRFARTAAPALEADAAHEDMGAVWFDADGDGDVDLYVVSGGVEFLAEDPRYRDRLYINDGKGGLTRASALPDIRQSGGPVVAADFDRDGDVDLFVGGRVVPGKYPVSPRSTLLRNDGGRFADATNEHAPQLAKVGLVTGAVWSDADADGWIDLLLTSEWGPVRWFRNNQGKLVDQTAAAGLADRSGWWNGIAPGDVDGDGDIDYLVTNFGLNTKYHASAEQPALLYYGQFGADGKYQLIEAEYENTTLFPVRGRSCSTHAIPILADRFSTYRDFAAASLPEIYTLDCLADAHRFSATTLETGILLNQADGTFVFRALPRPAQIAPAFGAIVRDFDADGVADILLAQNFFSPQRETGRMSGGVSLLLRGEGEGHFTPMWPDESGIVIAGDAKSAGAVDLNGDGALDVVIGVNDGQLATFTNRKPPAALATLRIVAADGQAPLPGVRGVIEFSDGSAETFETYAGGGYLSQSSAVQVTALRDGRSILQVRLRWPDGETSVHKDLAASGVIELTR